MMDRNEVEFVNKVANAVQEAFGGFVPLSVRYKAAEAAWASLRASSWAAPAPPLPTRPDPGVPERAGVSPPPPPDTGRWPWHRESK